MTPWSATDERVFVLPSGRLIRGRGLGAHPTTTPAPQFGVYLLDAPVDAVAWDHTWVEWPDFGIPTDANAVDRALNEALRRAATERVEIACMGGLGRTGTALACLCVLDGLPATDAISFVRGRYETGAVETPEQASYVSQFEQRQAAAHGQEL